MVVGPSGSGKSTLLRCINALETMDSGYIMVDGMVVGDRRTQISTLRAEVGMVFQSFNPFLHNTVLENVTLGPIKVRGLRLSVLFRCFIWVVLLLVFCCMWTYAGAPSVGDALRIVLPAA